MSLKLHNGSLEEPIKLCDASIYRFKFSTPEFCRATACTSRHLHEVEIVLEALL